MGSAAVPVALGLGAVGTGASLYGQSKARKETQKANEENRRAAILSEIMSVVSGRGPGGIAPTTQAVPQVDYGGALGQLGNMGLLYAGSVADQKTSGLQNENLQLRNDALRAEQGRSQAQRAQMAAGGGGYQPLGLSGGGSYVPPDDVGDLTGGLSLRSSPRINPDVGQMNIPKAELGLQAARDVGRVGATMPESVSAGKLDDYYKLVQENPERAKLMVNDPNLDPSEREILKQIISKSSYQMGSGDFSTKWGGMSDW